MNDFEYPLTKEIPCLKTDDRTFIVPMATDIFYAFVFPTTIPTPYVNIFENKLESLVSLKKIITKNN